MRLPLRWLLKLYPARFRSVRGEDLGDHVEQERERAAARGKAALAAFWLRTSLDLMASALRLRLWPERGVVGWRLELRYALRSLVAAPAMTAVVVLTLGVGIGLNTAIFSVVDAVLLQPLDYRDPSRLVHVRAEVAADEVSYALFSGCDFEDIRGGVDAFEDTAAVGFIRQNLTGAGLPRQVGVGWASGNLFEMLGVEAVVGRAFNETDPAGTAVLSHALWRDDLGSDASVLGTTVLLDGHPHVVVGVLPPEFRMHLPGFRAEGPELWKNPDTFWQNGDVWNLQGEGTGLAGLFRIVGRLRPGASLQQARQQLARVQAELRERVPTYEQEGVTLRATELHENVVQEVRPTLVLLTAAVGAVLLIACANVTGLLLVRAERRRRELSLRRALGAPRSRIAGLLLGESLLLAAGGGGAGLLLAVAGTRVLARMGPDLPRLDTVVVDLRVLGFALALSVGCTLLVGLVPALRAARFGPAEELKGARTVAGGAGARLRGGLVVAQLALSLVLLVGTGLLVSSLVRLQSVEPGFDPEDLLTFSASLPGAQYEWPDETGRFFLQLEDRLEALPGVRGAGVMWPIPLEGSRWSSRFSAQGPEGEVSTFVDYRVGSENYFDTMGTRLQEGRLFRDGDPRERVVVSRRVAEMAWPGQSAVGRVLQANPWGGGDVEFEVIGVVDDVRYQRLRDEPLGALYFDIRHWSWSDWEFTVVARTSTPPMSLVPAVREVLAEMDPEVPLAEPAAMGELMAADLAESRFALQLVGLFSTVAGLLALVGLYGVVSYAAGRRRREIGVRMALGSARAGITRLVLSEGARLILLGLLLGIVGAAAATRFLGAWLYQVEPTDPITYGVVALALAALALLATWIPARRAAAVDPMEVLRSE